MLWIASRKSRSVTTAGYGDSTISADMVGYQVDVRHGADRSTLDDLCAAALLGSPSGQPHGIGVASGLIAPRLGAADAINKLCRTLAVPSA